MRVKTQPGRGSQALVGQLAAFRAVAFHGEAAGFMVGQNDEQHLESSLVTGVDPVEDEPDGLIEGNHFAVLIVEVLRVVGRIDQRALDHEEEARRTALEDFQGGGGHLREPGLGGSRGSLVLRGQRLLREQS
jgi:hypothetical protein